MDENFTDECSDSIHQDAGRSKQVKFRRLQSAPASRKQILLYMNKFCAISRFQEYHKYMGIENVHRRPRTANMTSCGIQKSLDKATLSRKNVSRNATPASLHVKESKRKASPKYGNYDFGRISRDPTSIRVSSPRNMYSPFLVTQGRCNTWISDDKRREICSETIKERLKQDRNRRRHRSGSARRQKRRQPLLPTDEPKLREPNLVAIRRFKVAILCVRILIKWLRVIIQISDKKTIRTATEEQWHTLYTSEEAQKLAFNKSLFARERTFAKVPFWAYQIFNTDPDDRTENDCRKIHALLRGLKSFDKFTEKIQLSMCRAFRYICVSPGRVILRKGHVGFNFYFVFSGSVFVNIEDRNIEGEKFEKTEAVLVRGDSFGELALLQDIRRTASITCREMCEMLVVDKETFAKVCPKIFEKRTRRKRKVFKLFNPSVWTKEMVKSICTEAQIQEYKTNKVITTDDDEEWIYICMEGKCQIIRRLILDIGLCDNKRMEDKRPSTPMLSDEILDILGKIKNVQVKKDEDSDEDSEDNGLGKERMLDSMSLDYRKDGRRRRLMKQPDNRENVAQHKEKMVLKGPTTLTSLMTQNTKSPDGKNYVYLNIGSLLSEELFDLYCIMYPAKRSPNSTLILVSSGSRMMRIKRKNFFRVSTPDAIHHAKRIGKRQRYPTDEMLLESYKEKAQWDSYKTKIVQEIVRPHLHKNGRFSKITKAQINMMKERNQKKDILLSTLKRNTYISKANKIDELEDDDESDDDSKKQDEKEAQVISVLKYHLKNQENEPLPTDFSIGRRTSLLHGFSVQERDSGNDNTSVSAKRRYSTPPVINVELFGNDTTNKYNALTTLQEETV